MNEQNNKEQTWWERNKKKVFIIGGVVVAVGIGILIYKNKDAILALVGGSTAIANSTTPLVEETEKEAVDKFTTVVSQEIVTDNTPSENCKLVEVSSFIRNLPETWHASVEKQEEAKRLGIKLDPHQTIVDPYVKSVA